MQNVTILLFGTGSQLIRMQISPGFEAKNARESHPNLKLPNAKQKIQDMREQRALVQLSHGNPKTSFFSEAGSVTVNCLKGNL